MRYNCRCNLDISKNRIEATKIKSIRNQNMNTTKLENDEDFKEFEPDANEVMFGQKTLPDRPLTNAEVLTVKKIMLKLIDQKLKFKLIEMMSKAAKKQNNCPEKAVSHIPVTATMNFVDSQSTFIPEFSTTYQPLPNWAPFASAQYSEANWSSSTYAQ